MGFINTQAVQTGGALVPAEGNPDSKICFIGEAPARDELRTGRPFMGEAGRLFEHCLHKAGLLRGECYITNFSKYPLDKKRMNTIFTPQRGLKGYGLDLRDKLLMELEEVNADIFVPMGGPAMCALTGAGKITERRGYVTLVELPSGRVIKVLPTLHPASALYGGSFINIWYIAHDFYKANQQVGDPDSPNYDFTDIEIPSTFEGALSILERVAKQEVFAFDVEVINYEISCISFSNGPGWATSMPFYQVWTVEQELELWLAIARILENPATTKIGQNLLFDIGYLFSHQGIKVQGSIVDTMIGHHIMYPDMLKGLGFLASIYTNRQFWKDMVDFKSIKKED